MARAGIEPATLRFSGGCSYQLSYLAVCQEARHWCSGPLDGSDPDRARTGDLRRDRAAL